MRRNEILLDTHMILWAMLDDPKLNDKMRNIILDPNNTIYYSIASMWEVPIKYDIPPMPLSGLAFLHS